MTSEQSPTLEAALRIHLLLVDDEPDFKEIMLKHLSRMGIRLASPSAAWTRWTSWLPPPSTWSLWT